MSTLRALTAAALMLLPLAACAPGANGSAASAPDLGDEAAQIEVTNNNWSDMVVYAIRDGSRQRLGTVTSMRTQVFDLPPTIVSNAATSVRFSADPIGSTEAYVTEPIRVWPGEMVQFDIQSLITTSSLMAWDR